MMLKLFKLLTAQWCILHFELGGGGSSAPAPDPSIGIAAQANAELGKEALAFSKQQYEDNKPRQAMIDDLSRQVIDQQIASSKSSTALADDYADYMKGTYRPIEKSLALESQGYFDATPEARAGLEADYVKNGGDLETLRSIETSRNSEIDQATGKAAADVTQQFDNQDAQLERGLTSMGINPASGKYVDLKRQTGLAEASTKVGAINTARTGAKQLSWAKRMDASGLGRNLPGNQATSTGLALNAGNSAVNNAGVGAANARADGTAMNQGFSTGISANNSAGNLYLGQYGAQMQGYQADQASNGSAMAGLGSLAGMAMGAPSTSVFGKLITSSKNLKTDKTDIEDAEILEEVKGLQVQKWKYKKGVEDEGEHVGPYAEDFKSRFGLGDGKSISVIDEMGVTLSAVKALANKVDKLEAGLTSKRRAA